MRLLLVLTLAIAALPAPGAQARVRDLGPFPSFATKAGEQTLAAAAKDGHVRVVDLDTGARRTVRTPEGCSFAGARDGAILWGCPVVRDGYSAMAGRTLDLATGVVTALRTVDHRDFSGDVSGPTYIGLGRHWAVLLVYGYHFRYVAYLHRVTGEIRRGPDQHGALWADPDHPRLIRRLCSPLRRPTVPGEGHGLVLGELVMHGRSAAAVTYRDEEVDRGRLVLQRCGEPARTIRDCPALGCGSVVLDDRTLAWSEYARNHVGDARSTVRIRSLRTGRTRALRRNGGAQLFLSRRWLFAVENGRLLRITR